jgi:hypothetical protein
MYSVPWAGSQQPPSAAAYGGYHGQQQYVLPPAMYYSVDVECVAVGVDHNARAVAQISLVVRALHVDICIACRKCCHACWRLAARAPAPGHQDYLMRH